MLRDDPQDPFLHFALGMEYVRAGDHERALDAFDETLRLDPDYVAAYMQKARTLMALARHDDARSAIDAGIDAAQRIGDSHARDELLDLRQTLEGLAP